MLAPEFASCGQKSSQNLPKLHEMEICISKFDVQPKLDTVG